MASPVKMVTVDPPSPSFISPIKLSKKHSPFVLRVLIRFGWISNLLLFPGMNPSERRKPTTRLNTNLPFCHIYYVCPSGHTYKEENKVDSFLDIY